MRKSKIVKEELHQAIREKAGVDTPEQVKSACLERGGEITVIPFEQEPRIISIDIKEGVQRVEVKIR